MRVWVEEKGRAWPLELRNGYRSLATDLDELAVRTERLADDFIAHKEAVDQKKARIEEKADGETPRKPRKWSAKARKRVKLRNSARKAWQKRREGAPGYASPSMTELRKQRRERQKETRGALDKLNEELLSSAAIPNDEGQTKLGFTLVGSSH